MNNDRYEIRFSGSGGQGIITAAIVFAEAAASNSENHVCQTQSYGPEARGGTSKAEIIISVKAIDYPKTIGLDLLLALNQRSCDAYFADLKPKGLLVVDSNLVPRIPTERAVAFSFTQIARDEIGKELGANMVALGSVAHLTQIVPIKNLEETVIARVPKGTEQMNLKALHAGIEAAKKVDLNTLPPTVYPIEEEV